MTTYVKNNNLLDVTVPNFFKQLGLLKKCNNERKKHIGSTHCIVY